MVVCKCFSRFEGYFNDLARFLRMQSNDTVYADKVDTVQDRIDVHEKFNQNVCGQVFLHYNDQKGILEDHHKYDRRPRLGLPYTIDI